MSNANSGNGTNTTSLETNVTNVFGSPYSATPNADPYIYMDGPSKHPDRNIFIKKPIGIDYADLAASGSKLILYPYLLKAPNKLIKYITSSLAGGIVLDGGDINDGVFTFKNDKIGFTEGIAKYMHVVIEVLKEQTKGTGDTTGLALLEEIDNSVEQLGENTLEYMIPKDDINYDKNNVGIAFYMFGVAQNNISASSNYGTLAIGEKIKNSSFTGNKELIKEMVALEGNEARSTMVKGDKTGEVHRLGKLYYTPVFPKVWKDSSIDKSYNVSLRFSSPYGDAYSKLINIWFPIVTIMAFVLPRDASGGNNPMKTSPYAVKAKIGESVSIRRGIITNVTIDFKEYSGDGSPSVVDVNLTIGNLINAVTFKPGIKTKLTDEDLTYMISEFMGENVHELDRKDSILDNIRHGLRNIGLTISPRRFGKIVLHTGSTLVTNIKEKITGS